MGVVSFGATAQAVFQNTKRCDHDDEDIDAGVSDGSCWMGAGHKLTKKRCRKCGRERGPFLPKGVGEGY
jgi:hypothetical protein